MNGQRPELFILGAHLGLKECYRGYIGAGNTVEVNCNVTGGGLTIIELQSTSSAVYVMAYGKMTTIDDSILVPDYISSVTHTGSNYTIRITAKNDIVMNQRMVRVFAISFA